MKVDIAIPSYRGGCRIGRSLAALREHSGDSIGKIVVSCDHAETLAKHSLIEEDVEKVLAACLEFGAEFVRPNGWGYMARNWNNAVEHCTADVVVVLNDDVEVVPDWLDFHLFMWRNAHQLPMPLGGTSFSFRDGSGPHRGWGGTETAFFHPGLAGPCFSIRRDLWWGIGEDSQLCEAEAEEWVWQAGCCVLAGPRPCLKHLGNAAHQSGVAFGEKQQGGEKSREAWARRYGYDFVAPAWYNLIHRTDLAKPWAQRMLREVPSDWPPWVVFDVDAMI